jgi:hypothetical protein
MKKLSFLKLEYVEFRNKNVKLCSLVVEYLPAFDIILFFPKLY